mmetsp:Transcript_47827/g.145463  ORF Transcript_47827/g.145463 Transcript_47827/m.145463 type:complete len:370 (+) Transcript_47827:188-1297(+)
MLCKRSVAVGVQAPQRGQVRPKPFRSHGRLVEVKGEPVPGHRVRVPWGRLLPLVEGVRVRPPEVKRMAGVVPAGRGPDAGQARDDVVTIPASDLRKQHRVRRGARQTGGSPEVLRRRCPRLVGAQHRRQEAVHWDVHRELQVLAPLVANILVALAKAPVANGESRTLYHLGPRELQHAGARGPRVDLQEGVPRGRVARVAAEHAEAADARGVRIGPSRKRREAIGIRPFQKHFASDAHVGNVDARRAKLGCVCPLSRQVRAQELHAHTERWALCYLPAQTCVCTKPSSRRLAPVPVKHAPRCCLVLPHDIFTDHVFTQRFPDLFRREYGSEGAAALGQPTNRARCSNRTQEPELCCHGAAARTFLDLDS